MHQYDRTGLPSLKRVHANSELALPHLEGSSKTWAEPSPGRFPVWWVDIAVTVTCGP